MTPRIVSLLPSATEIVSALGFGEHLVGRSHECDFPPGVEALPVCTEPKIAPGQTSREIHENVSEVLRSEISVYRVHAGLLRDLRPTHIVTQIQCEICAVSLRDVEAALCDWADPRPRIVALNPRSLRDVYDDIRRTASALDVPDAGERVIDRMAGVFETIRRATSPASPKPRVAMIEWLDPLMAAGNWIPELVEIAGGTNVSWSSYEELVAADPDVLIIVPCGFTIEQSERDLALLDWGSLRAVRNGRVSIIDGSQFFNRPGPRLAESAQILAQILHPETFPEKGSSTGFSRCFSPAPAAPGSGAPSPGR